MEKKADIYCFTVLVLISELLFYAILFEVILQRNVEYCVFISLNFIGRNYICFMFNVSFVKKSLLDADILVGLG